MSYVINTMIDWYKVQDEHHNNSNMMCMGAQAPPGPAPTTYAIPINANHISMDMGHDIALHHFNSPDNADNSHHSMNNNMNVVINVSPQVNENAENILPSEVEQRILPAEVNESVISTEVGENQIMNMKKSKRLRDPFKKKDYLCEDCGKQLSSSFQLKNHKRTHTGEKPFMCDNCGKAFISTGSLKSHLRKVHDIKNPKLTYHYAKSGRPKSTKPAGLTFNCDICQKEFQKRKNLSSHRRLHFPKRHFCEFCNKAFHKKTNLTLHLNIHLGRKPYVCKVCNKSFCAKSNLTSHEKIHSTEKPFRCSLCDKAFISKLYLKYHCRNHQYTDRKDNYCLKCKRQFNNVLHYNTHLVNHHRQNPKSKPYACSKCRISYSQRNSLKEHLKKYHPETQGDFKALDHTKCTSALKMVKESFDLEKLTEKVVESGVHLCRVCFASYSKKLLLDKHIALKHPDYEKEVEIVNKKLDKENLRKKNIILPKMIGFVCKLCLIPYTMKIHLMKHISKIHPELYKEEMIVPKSEIDSIVEGVNKNHSVTKVSEIISKGIKEAIRKPAPVVNNVKKTIPQKTVDVNESNFFADSPESNEDFGQDNFGFYDSPSEHNDFDAPPVSGTSKVPVPQEEKVVKPKETTCISEFYDDEDLNKLYEQEGELEVFYCDMCLSCYSMKIHLKKHYMKMHSENTEKIEQLAAEIEAEKKAKKKPKVTKKKEPTPISCEICGKTFNHRANLKMHHSQVHIDERCFPCNVCSQTFKTKKHQIRHELVHSKEKNYECATCHTKFKYRDGWRRHVKKGGCVEGQVNSESEDVPDSPEVKKRRGRPAKNKKINEDEKLDEEIVDEEEETREMSKTDEQRSKRKTREPKKVILEDDQESNLSYSEEEIISEYDEDSDDEYTRKKRKRKTVASKKKKEKKL